MFCTNCGKPIPDDSRFCTECGAPVELVEAVEAFDAPEQPVYQQEPQQPVYQQESQEPVYQQEPQEPVYQQEPQEPVYQQESQEPVYQQEPQEPVYQQPVYQQPVYQQPVYPRAPKSFDIGALWNNPTKRPFFYMAGIAVLSFFALLFNYVKTSIRYIGDYFGYGAASKGASGYDLLECMGERFLSLSGWMVLLIILSSVAILVTSFLALKGGIAKNSTLRILFMVESLVFATAAMLIVINILSSGGSTGLYGYDYDIPIYEFKIAFGSILNILLGGGLCFVFFSFLNKSLVD